MAKKKKIREEFDNIFKSGNEKAIKKMLDKYPWLLSEVSSEMEKVMGDQQQVIAALGVMEDELGGAVPVDEIVFSLKLDFNIRLNDEEVLEILKNVEELGLVKRDTDGWILTREGGRICDEFLNKNLKNNI
jgi:Ca2+-binding EF-hand superfamily protein